MKALYVMDLHGEKDKYRKSLDIAVKRGISVIINGGDMLPKLGERHIEQPVFIRGFLKDYLSILKKHNITYLTMLGNDDLLWVDELLPYMCDILNALPEPENPKQAVYVMHMPPAGLRLGQLLYQDLDIGSVDIYDFLKEKQPLLSLHGHIHESPDTEKGKWINQIIHTTCIQLRQTELGDNDMVYVELDLQKQEFSRKTANVR